MGHTDPGSFTFPMSALLIPGACAAMVASWDALAARLPSLDAPRPKILDTVLNPSAPAPEGLTLFRERHGWCPYSEKVWLALELKGLDYKTVLIDNTGGGRPAWYGGQTPQIQWEDGRKQGESMDIVKQLDLEYPESRQLYPPDGVSQQDVAALIGAFRGAFPSNARPSSRAAYLFSYSGPLSRSDFEKALTATDKLLAQHDGPFFVGGEVTAADVSWAPFLERYAAQVCTHHARLEQKPRAGGCACLCASCGLPTHFPLLHSSDIVCTASLPARWADSAGLAALGRVVRRDGQSSGVRMPRQGRWRVVGARPHNARVWKRRQRPSDHRLPRALEWQR